MKKRFFFSFLLIFAIPIALLINICVRNGGDGLNKRYPGEVVVAKNEDTGRQLATFTITDITVLDDESYEAVVRIDYKSSALDSPNKISGWHFTVYDHMRKEAAYDGFDKVYEGADFVVVGLQRKGDMTIMFPNNHLFDDIKIVCEYDKKTNSYTIRSDNTLLCGSCGMEIEKKHKYCRFCGNSLENEN